MKLSSLRISCTALLLFIAAGYISAQDYCDALFTDNEFSSVQKTVLLYDRVEEPTGYVDSIDLYLDLYYSTENSQEVQPMMILLHGGSFITELGDRSGMEEISRLMASKGFVVASISYRTWSLILGGTPAVDQIVDVVTKAMLDLQSAIEYITASHGQGEFPAVDVQNLVVGGGSAGAVTALHRMYIDEDDELPDFLAAAFANNGGLFPSRSDDYGIAYGINLSGGILDTALIDQDEPPLISIHGDADDVVFYERGLANGVIELYGSKPIDERLMNLGVESYFYTFEGGGHTDIYEDIPLYRDPLLQVLDTALGEIHDNFCLRTNSQPELTLADVNLRNTLVQSELIVENGELRNLKYQIVDMWGRTLQSGDLAQGTQRIAFQSRVGGYFALQVYGVDDGGQSRYQQLFYYGGQ